MLSLHLRHKNGGGFKDYFHKTSVREWQRYCLLTSTRRCVSTCKLTAQPIEVIKQCQVARCRSARNVRCCAVASLPETSLAKADVMCQHKEGEKKETKSSGCAHESGLNV